MNKAPIFLIGLVLMLSLSINHDLFSNTPTFVNNIELPREHETWSDERRLIEIEARKDSMQVILDELKEIDHPDDDLAIDVCMMLELNPEDLDPEVLNNEAITT